MKTKTQFALCPMVFVSYIDLHLSACSLFTEARGPPTTLHEDNKIQGFGDHSQIMPWITQVFILTNGCKDIQMYQEPTKIYINRQFNPKFRYIMYDLGTDPMC